MQTQSLNQKILFTLIPPGLWILLFVAILLAFMGGIGTGFSNIAFNLFFAFFGVKLAVFIHETGHLVLAKLVGGTPRRMVLGRSHKVLQTEVYGIKVILNSKLNSGLAYAAFNNLERIRIKLLLYTFGGILFNFSFAGILWLFFDFSTGFSEGIFIPSMIAYANLLIGFSALIPFKTSYHGLQLNSDGLSLLKIPFYEEAEVVELSYVSEFLDAYDLIEAKKYEEAIKIYEQFQSKVEDSKGVNVNLGIAYMKLGEHEKALSLLEELLPLIDEDKFQAFNGHIYNGLAWLYLLLDRLEEADKYSDLAYQLDPQSEYFRGTRGSVLIERGEFEAGKKLLINDVDFNFPNNQTLAAALYLSLVFEHDGDLKKKEQYMDFVESNLDLLDPDEMLLYHRVKNKKAI